MTDQNGFDAPRQLLDKRCYYDTEWFARERKALFDDSWIYACLDTDISQPGDYHCLRFMDHSLVVLRDTDGTPRAYHNICRHRGCGRWGRSIPTSMCGRRRAVIWSGTRRSGKENYAPTLRYQKSRRRVYRD